MISINGSNTGLYLGSTQIGQAYLGSTLVYQHLPANSLLIRFSDSNFNPSTATVSNGVKQGTWTQRTGSQYNDWVWQNSSNDWKGGFCVDNTTNRDGVNDRLFGNQKVTVIGAGDNTAVTDVQYMFKYVWNLEIACDLRLKNSSGLAVVQVARNSPNIESYEAFTKFCPRSGTAGWDEAFDTTDATIANYRVKSLDSITKPQLVSLTKYAAEHNIQISTFYNTFKAARCTGSANTVFSHPAGVAPGANANGTFASCTQLTEALTNWPANLTGDCGDMFFMCFNAANALASYNAMIASGCTYNKYTYRCAGINLSAGRTALRNSIPSNAGGGDEQILDGFSPNSQFIGFTANSGEGYYAKAIRLPKCLGNSGITIYNACPWSALNSTSIIFRKSDFYGQPGSTNAGTTAPSETIAYCKLAMVQFEPGYNFTNSGNMAHLNWWNTTGTIFNIPASSTSVSKTTIEAFRSKVFGDVHGTLDESRPVFLVFYVRSGSQAWNDPTKWYIYHGKNSSTNVWSWTNWNVSVKLSENTVWATS